MIKMNPLRSILLIAVGILVMASAQASAQRGPDSLRTERHVSMLKERLSLSDSQASQIRDILKQDQQNALKERGTYKGSREAANKAREERRQATDERIKAVLNNDQKKEYDKVKNDLRPDYKKQRPGKMRNGDPRGAGMRPDKGE